MVVSKENIINLLHDVPDPEVPVLSVVDLGIVRDIHFHGEEMEVVITPTYSGCPAMKTIEIDILEKLKENGFEMVKITTVLSPVWTTDWISDAAKEKLRTYGIAPPEKTTSDKSAITGKPKTMACPRCGSAHTEMISQFGSTACKALYRCLDCREPFDYFKCI